MYILSSGDITYLFIILRHKEENIMHAYKVLLVYVDDVLSVDISAFQRPFMKPYNDTTRRHRIKTKISLDLLYALVIHYVSYE